MEWGAYVVVVVFFFFLNILSYVQISQPIMVLLKKSEIFFIYIKQYYDYII